VSDTATTDTRDAAALESNVFDTALVLEGGGLRASYTGGILNVLLEQRIFFDFVCGISAGSSHSADYLSRDTKRVRGSFVELAASPRFGGLRTLMRGEGYINSSYDYAGCIVDGSMPFDWDTFAANPARMAIQAFERDTGKTVVWTKNVSPETDKLVTSANLVGCVRAGSTMPFLMKPIRVDGKMMYDGGLGEGAGLPTHLAEDQGFRRFVVILSQERGYAKELVSPAKERTLRRVAKNFPFLVDALLTRPVRYNAALAHLRMLEEEGRALLIYPDEMPVRNATLDYPRLAESYEMGHAQGVRELPRVLDFLFGDGDAGRAAARAAGVLVDPVDEAEAVAASFPQEAFDAYQAETKTPELLR
jgi:predicted patatin/cPLA2 family phospholipase